MVLIKKLFISIIYRANHLPTPFDHYRPKLCDMWQVEKINQAPTPSAKYRKLCIRSPCLPRNPTTLQHLGRNFYSPLINGAFMFVATQWIYNILLWGKKTLLPHKRLSHTNAIIGRGEGELSSEKVVLAQWNGESEPVSVECFFIT